MDAGVGVLDEGTCVAIEVDRLLGIEGHVLAGIHLEDEVLECTESYDAGDILGLFGGESVELAQLLRGVACGGYHFGHEVIGIHYGAFAALHLAFGQLYHAVREVHEVLAPVEAELVEQDREHLEVVVLLVAHHVDHLVDGVVLEAQLGGTDILCHVYRCAVATEQELMVEALTGEVGPYRAILLAEEETLLQTLHHLLLTFEVGLRFVVYLVEVYAHHLVCLVESGIYPLVHHLPQAAHLGVASLPLHEHLAGLGHQGRLGLCLLLGAALALHDLGYLGLVVLVEGHVVVAYEVVALLARCLGSFSFAILLPSQH